MLKIKRCLQTLSYLLQEETLLIPNINVTCVTLQLKKKDYFLLNCLLHHSLFIYLFMEFSLIKKENEKDQLEIKSKFLCKICYGWFQLIVL